MEKLEVGRSMAKVNDPVRAAAYADLGISTICRTTMLSDAIQEFVGLRPSGMPAVIEAVAHHHEPAAAPNAANAANAAGAAGGKG
jgi:hypothetical protein